MKLLHPALLRTVSGLFGVFSDAPDLSPNRSETGPEWPAASEPGDRVPTFTRLPQSQWRSARTANAIERLHEKFKRRIKIQTVLPSAETAAMPFWSLHASGQITIRKVDGWQSLGSLPASMPL